MGSINEISCDNCDFKLTTNDNTLRSVCEIHLDYYNKLYCTDCNKVVKIWKRQNGEEFEDICPMCNSQNVYLLLPDNCEIKCPKCKKGNLESDIIMYRD